MHYQLSLVVKEQDLPLAELCIEQLDALSVSYLPAHVHQPEIYEPELGATPKWEYTEIQLLFDKPPEDAWLFFLRDQLNLPIVRCYCEKIAHQDWQKQIIAETRPIYFEDKLVVGPEEYLSQLTTSHIKLFLTPGLAFGTGTHPTTNMCLTWLSSQEPVDYVIDYGCGSGILAIAALLLGSQKVTAVDIDPQALLATRNNAMNNHLTEQQLSVCLPEALPGKQTKLLIANILAKPLIALAPDFAKLVESGGKLLLAGILVEQQALLYNTYCQWFTVKRVAQQENWALLEAQRK